MTAKMGKHIVKADLFCDVFRLSGEPFQYINEADVHKALTVDPTGYFQFVKQRLANIANKKATLDMPAKMLFPDDETDGDFRVMPCIIKDGNKVMKTVKLVGTNVIQQCVPNQITVGKACVIHPTENFITHIVEACLLSSARTAICAMLGIELLAKRREKITIFGAGRVGYYSALYASSMSWVDEVVIFDIDMQRAHDCVNMLRSEFPAVSFVVSTREKLTDTDVLLLCTTSKTPIYSRHDFHAGLIVSVGADTDSQRELDDSWAQTGSLFVDSHDSARYGDIRAWNDKGLLENQSITDLFSLLRGFDVVDDQRPRIFISTGTAFFDNLTLSYLLEKPSEQGLYL